MFPSPTRVGEQRDYPRASGMDVVEQVNARFGPLNAVEEAFVRGVAAGQPAAFSEKIDLSFTSPPELDPSKGIRSELVRWFCAHSAGRRCVEVRGLSVHNAIIVGRVNLAFLTLPFPVALVGCWIPEGIDLTEADIRSLVLDSSRSGSIAGSQLLVRGSLYLRDGFRADGEVRLRGASIKGSLECRGACLFNPREEALSANGLDVEGSVLMDQGFRATGKVRLAGANIGKMFVCSGGCFYNPHEEALIADGIRVGGSILMDQGFRSFGEVRLIGANVNGDLACRGARMINRANDALSADGINVLGSVNLNRGFRCLGRVRLVGATIRRDLSVRDAAIRNVGREGLALDRARVEGNVYFDGSFRGNCVVSLRATRVHGDVVFWHAEFHSEKETGLIADNAQIDGKLVWKNMALTNLAVLSLAYARVGQLADDEGSWPGAGKLAVVGFVYGAIAEGPTDAKRRLRWLQLQARDMFFSQPYDQLVSVLRSAGRDDDALRVAISGEDARLRFGEAGWSGRTRRWFMKYVIDYGYKPHHKALQLGAAVVLAGWLFFFLGDLLQLYSPTRERVYLDEHVIAAGKMPDDYPVLNSLVYSLDAFVPFVDFHQEDYWLPNANRYCDVAKIHIPCGSMLRVYLWMHISLGWIVATVFAAGLTGLVKRE